VLIADDHPVALPGAPGPHDTVAALETDDGGDPAQVQKFRDAGLRWRRPKPAAAKHKWLTEPYATATLHSLRAGEPDKKRKDPPQ
jgi:hypothetical protein